MAGAQSPGGGGHLPGICEYRSGFSTAYQKRAQLHLGHDRGGYGRPDNEAREQALRPLAVLTLIPLLRLPLEDWRQPIPPTGIDQRGEPFAAGREMLPVEDGEVNRNHRRACPVLFYALLKDGCPGGGRRKPNRIPARRFGCGDGESKKTSRCGGYPRFFLCHKILGASNFVTHTSGAPGGKGRNFTEILPKLGKKVVTKILHQGCNFFRIVLC